MRKKIAKTVMEARGITTHVPFTKFIKILSYLKGVFGPIVTGFFVFSQ